MRLKGILLVLLLGALWAELGHTKPSERTFSVNIQNASLEEVLKIIAQKSGLVLEMTQGQPIQVSYNFHKKNLPYILDRVTGDQGFRYSIVDGVLSVYRENSNYISGDESGQKASGRNGSIKHPVRELFRLAYLSLADVKDKINAYLIEGEKIILDDASNSFVFEGSVETRKMIVMLLESFDKMPEQILIEAKIVEISKKKSRELGFSFDANSPSSFSASANNPAIISPTNMGVGMKLGVLSDSVLQLKLAAAEADGDAKIISRPNVVTVNNVPANIRSGITYHVKTFSQQGVTGTTPSEGEQVVGTLQSITAGLDLQVLPTMVGSDRVKLQIKVSNSEPDESAAVDGIPGIVDNSAETTVIINNNQTATLAGLIKSSFSKNKTGTPYLSDIPVLGWFFKSVLERENDSELIIFITPRIIGSDWTKIAPPKTEEDPILLEEDGAKSGNSVNHE